MLNISEATFSTPTQRKYDIQQMKILISIYQET